MLEKSEIPVFLQQANLYDELPSGCLSFTPEGTILAVNKTFAKWIGETKEGLVSKNAKSLLSKASLLYYNLFLDPLFRIQGFVEEINLQFLSKEGSFDVLFNGRSYKDKSGTTVLIIASVVKIGDRKKYEVELLTEKRIAEEQQSKLQFLINLVPIQIWTADPQGRIKSMNLQIQEYFGSFSFEQGSEFFGVYEPDREAAFEDWKESIKDGKRFERELRLVGLSGNPEWFLVRGEPYYNSENNIDMWFCCSININKRKLLQIANQKELKSNLSSAYETLDHHEAKLSTIALNQSHMVRKPLANILGLIDVLKDKPEPEDFSIMLNMLYNSVEELDLMVRKISKDTHF
jgi:PAS domain S-box-containing protein